MDESREVVVISIRGKDLYQYLSAISNTSVAVLYIKDEENKDYQEVGRTEVVLRNNSPDYVTNFKVDFLFEMHQKCKIMFYQLNTNIPPEDLSPFPILGETEFTLSQLMHKGRGFLSLPLTNRGSVEIRGIPLVDNRDLLRFKLIGDLKTNNWINNPRPFILISRIDEKGDYIKVLCHKDPAIGATTTPIWEKLEFRIDQLCNGDLHCPLNIKIIDDLNQNIIGELTEISVDQIVNAGGVSIPLKPNGGFLTFSNPTIEHRLTFFSLLKMINLSLAVAYDFTSSNGHPKTRTSLHYVDRKDESNYNIYQACTESTGHIIIEYDSDKRIPVIGFGARLLDEKTGKFGAVSHCFPLSKEEVVGVEGIMEAYKSCFDYIQLSGPTLLEPVIRKATEDARKAAETKLNYTVYLIITDGSIQDIEETTKAVIEASSEPISFIIMGVGSGDFTNMELLDSDKELLSFGDLKASRDIVQFVRFEPGMHPTLLAKKVLQEIPDQVTQYYDQLYKLQPERFVETE